MLRGAAAALLLGVAAPALAAPFDRVNDGECISASDEVDFASLAQRLNDSVACTGGDSCEFKATFATDFSIEYFDNFKIVTNNYNETSPYVAVLYPCGTQQPGANAVQRLLPEAARVGYFAVPLTAVATGDTTAGWALEALGLEDRVRFASFATAPCLMKVMAPENATFTGCGRDFVADNDFTPDGVTPTPLNEFDAEFVFSPADPSLKQIPFTASADPSPLARVQHLVYMGAFFNAEARATARVQEIAAAYRAAAVPSSDGPVVVWASRSTFLAGYVDADGNPFPEVMNDHFTFSYARYKTQLTSDAGGQLLPAADVGAAEVSGARPVEGAVSAGEEVKFIVSLYDSEAAVLAALQPLLKQVDVFIHDGTPPEGGLTGFKAQWGIPAGDEAMYPFLANEKVFSHDKDQTADGLDDWFGEAVLRPDLVLKDLRKALGAETVLPGYTPTFFRNIATGVEATVATGAACMDLSCDAYVNQEALPIAQLAAPAPAPAGAAAPGEPSSAARKTGLQAASACALVFVAVLAL